MKNRTKIGLFWLIIILVAGALGFTLLKDIGPGFIRDLQVYSSTKPATPASKARDK
jgi:hypothetical protein